MAEDYEPQEDGDETNNDNAAASSNGADQAAEAAEASSNGADQAAEAAEATRNELEALKAKTAEYLEGWQRSRAEFANYKRRVEKDQSETYQNAAARIIGRFLDVNDDFDRAMQEKPADPTDGEAMARWAAGVGLIQRKLQNILEVEGVERVPAEGQAFDPKQHEAVTQEESDEHEPGEIIGVVRQGYRLGDRIIRPAMVRVAK